MTGSSRVIRATVDTNLFVSAALRTQGHPGQILQAWRRNAFVLVTSAELTAEITAVFQRPRLVERFRISPAEQTTLITGLAGAEEVTPRSPLPIQVRDPKDTMVLACALGGQVDYLVAGDEDLLALADHPTLGTVRIVTPRAFLVVLGIDPDQRY
jgi:putative PIN family toxin of toxin-antitoxin system